MIVHSFDYPPLDGGISRLCAEIASGSGALVLSQQSATGAGSFVPGVPEFRVTTRRPRREWEAFLRLLRVGRGSAVLCGTWYPEGLLASLAGVRPLVVLAHGSELYPPKQRWRRPIWAVLRRWVLRSADLVIANSEYTRELALKLAPGCKVAAVPLGVDHHRFSPRNREQAKAFFDVTGKIVVGTAARVHLYKGHDTVIRAIASLPESQRSNLVYVVAGKGPDLPQLRELARSLCVADHVRWLGYVPEEDLPNFYNACDLFALCTRDDVDETEVEGFGLVFLEAQACGTPAVGARSGGIPDAVAHGDGGWLIEPDDVGGLAVILNRLVDDTKFFQDAGIAARARVERAFTWDHYRRRLAEALEAEGLTLA